MGEGKEGGAPPPPKETSQGLPVVSENTIDSMKQTHGERWGEYLEEVKTRLLNENPSLVNFIESQVGKYLPEAHNPMFEVVVGTLAVLEQQAMVNKKQSIFANVPKERLN
jgi:hypothetical protein